MCSAVGATISTASAVRNAGSVDSIVAIAARGGRAWSYNSRNLAMKVASESPAGDGWRTDRGDVAGAIGEGLSAGRATAAGGWVGSTVCTGIRRPAQPVTNT